MTYTTYHPYQTDSTYRTGPTKQPAFGVMRPYCSQERSTQIASAEEDIDELTPVEMSCAYSAR